MRISFGPQTCGRLEEGAAREWLLTDGLGGYSMGTVSDLRTRRYHGLLVPSVGVASDRMLALVALDPVLVTGDARHRLATHEWAGGTVDPRGFELLAAFWLDRGLPHWRWQVGDLVLERTIAMTRGRAEVGIVHRLVRADRPVRLELTPLCTWRNVHGERFGDGDPQVDVTPDGFVFEGSYRVAGPDFRRGGAWYRGVRAREEAARGLSDGEDVWAAGTFVAELTPGEAMEVSATAAPLDESPTPARRIVSGASVRADAITGDGDPFDGQLLLAADQFRITTSGRPTAVAGYPWFGEWSRDLMTSYEGLYLTANRVAEGREVLRTAAASVSEGMLANTADTGTLEYNTVDGTLWFVHALGRHATVGRDPGLRQELAPVVDAIVQHHVDGTRYGIVADADGLLRQGSEGWALTWMDARIDGRAMTPRIGKPVEVNALWIETLRLAGDRWAGLAARATDSFVSRFARPDGAGLYDVVDGAFGDDASVRPNQLLAVSLPDGPFDALGADLARRVVDVCRHTLLTPLGLRSLSPEDPAYRPYHRGSPFDRDAAYHQGTVWPWLVGPYVDAAVRVGVPVDGVIDALEAHLGEWGIGSVSETADGAPPHEASGCPFQAWSVAELLRVRRTHGPAPLSSTAEAILATVR